MQPECPCWKQRGTHTDRTQVIERERDVNLNPATSVWRVSLGCTHLPPRTQTRTDAKAASKQLPLTCL